MAGNFEKGAKIQRIEGNLDNPVKALTQIGMLMVAETQAAFKAQKLGKKSWNARAPINIFGLISDFASGREEPKSRRFDRRPALIDTGGLKRSINSEVTGDHVAVGTVIPYAHVHQFGGKTKSEKLTETIQSAIGKWLKKKGKKYKDKLGWLLNKDKTGEQLEQNIEPRPFIGVTDDTHKMIKKVIGVKIMEVE